MSDFYKSMRWRRLRSAVLRRDGYRDVIELRRGRSVEASIVHHIFPREQYPEYQWERWNLISISRDTHEQLHNRVTGGLSAVGRALQLEISQRQGIPLSRLILVCGLPGSGKTTYVQRHLGGGLAYDLDYLAAAFRLTQPHRERHEAARKLANTLASGFAVNARQYAGTVFIIRTAPAVEDAEQYDPDELVICRNGSGGRAVDDESGMEARLTALREWAEANGVPVTLA